MSPAAYSFEYLLATTIRAALYDSELERSGKEIAFFFDADVIAGSLFARDKIEEDIERKIPFTRSVVRALWLQGQLPRVRLTVSHLHELRVVLRSIEKCGGIASHLGQHHSQISRKYGLTSTSRAREHLILLFNTLRSRKVGDEDQLTDVIDNLGIEEFAIIEAELAANLYYEKELLRDQIELDGDLGESESHIEAEDSRFKLVVEALSSKRPTRLAANRSDAASLLAIARLWARDHETGVEYRFYTHTDAVRIFCDATPIGRQLMTKPGFELPMNTPCTDSPLSAVRSSTYFILRAAFPSVGFHSPEDNPELLLERLMLKDAATSLLQSAGERTDRSFASLRIAEQASGITLGELLLDLRNRSFTKQMLTERRDRVLESLRRLSRRIEGMGDLRARLIRHESRMNDMLVKDAGRFARSISSTVVARDIHRRLLEVDIPSEEECALSLDRWNIVFSSKAARENANAGLRQFCHPDQSEKTSWVNTAHDTLRSLESVDDALAVIVPLLTLGEFQTPLKFFEQCEEPRAGSSRVSFHALKTWALSMPPTPIVEVLLESWAEFNNRFRLAGTASPTGAESGRRDRPMMAAWVAVYVSSCLRNLASDRSIPTDLPRVTARGKEWVDAVLNARQSNEPLYEMGWAAKLILLANEAWCAGDVRELRTARDECSRAAKEEPSLYLTSARYWATYVEWHKGATEDQILLDPELSAMRVVAFERFQVTLKDSIRAER